MKLLKNRNFWVLLLFLGFGLTTSAVFAQPADDDDDDDSTIIPFGPGPSFSIDRPSTTTGAPDLHSPPLLIDQNDVLRPSDFPSDGNPDISFPFVPFLIPDDEVDALPSPFFSLFGPPGGDGPPGGFPTSHGGIGPVPIGLDVFFSVDSAAVGVVGTGVDLENLGIGAGDPGAAADVFRTSILNLGTNSLAFDSSDLDLLPAEADNLDGLELDPLFGQSPILFSLGPGSPSLPSIGPGPGPALPGDILIYSPFDPAGGPPFVDVFIPAVDLGLDAAGSGTDNLDALFVIGDIFSGPPQGGLDNGNGPDIGNLGIVVFSVDAESAIIGTDTTYVFDGSSVPIRQGDLLIPDPSGGLPLVIARAEDLGLIGGSADAWNGDELDALDVEVRFADLANPILPEVFPELPGDPFEFLFFTVPGIPYPVDPPVAVGYEYHHGTGPLFASVTLPFVGDDLYTLDTTFGTFALAAGVPFDFLGPTFGVGVSSFTVTGIEPGAGLDPLDPLAFVTILTFDSLGVSDMTMTPITEDVIPEPSTFVLFGIGLFSVVGYGWRRRKRLVK